MGESDSVYRSSRNLAIKCTACTPIWGWDVIGHAAGWHCLSFLVSVGLRRSSCHVHTTLSRLCHNRFIVWSQKFICVIVFCDVRLYFHFTLQAVFLLSRIVHIICAVRYRTVVSSYVDTEMVVVMIMMVITCVVFQCACWWKCCQSFWCDRGVKWWTCIWTIQYVLCCYVSAVYTVGDVHYSLLWSPCTASERMRPLHLAHVVTDCSFRLSVRR